MASPTPTRRARRALALAEYVALRATIAARYRARPLDTLVRALGRRRTRAPLPATELAEVVRQADRLISRLRVVPDTCLFRSLARFGLAARWLGHGPAVVFRMGLPASGSGPGHAWLTLDGAAWLEPTPAEMLETFTCSLE
ncbi:MAG: lasso peptide biosynthesis protein [Polyangiaceae bacterium]|nr:lasso peptide biosynthesis protein [Polyangiaceae bacterium]